MSPHADEFLEVVVGLTRSAGGAFWSVSTDGRPVLLAQRGLGRTKLDQVHSNWPGHADRLVEVARQGRPATLAARMEEAATAGPSRELWLAMLPISLRDGEPGIVELFLTGGPPIDVEALAGGVRRCGEWFFAPAASGPGDADFIRRLSEIHAHLDLERTCRALAREAQAWSGWDRVSVAVRYGAGLRVESIGGWETFDRRSGAVRELESLVATVHERSLPAFWEETPANGSAASTPESITREDALRRHGERVGAAAVCLVPLFSAREEKLSRLIGALVFERFGPVIAPRPPEELVALVPHATAALSHALEHRRATASAWTRWTRGLVGRPGRIAATAAVLTGLIVAALMGIQSDLVVSGRGTLRPLRQRDLFANETGIVEEILVRNPAVVKQGEPLIRLRSPDLEFERSRLSGELATVRQQIGDLETLRGDPRRGGDSAGASVEELAARSEELKAVGTSLERQLELLERRMAELTLTGPIDGQVLNWDLEQLLSGRPVNRTDRLLTVADVSGPWIVEASIDPWDGGPVLEAFAQGKAKMTFVTTDAPNRVFAATIREFAPGLAMDPTLGWGLPLQADVEPSQLRATRPGTAVSYRIDCGRAAIGRVWFRRLLDRLSAWWALL